MNRSLKLAFERCPSISPVSLEKFLDDLLDREPKELARMSGTPATVLAAQFTYYAKTAVRLTEELRRDETNAKKLADLIWSLSQREAEASEDAPGAGATPSTEPEDIPHDPDLPPDKAQ